MQHGRTSCQTLSPDAGRGAERAPQCRSPAVGGELADGNGCRGRVELLR